MKKRGRPSLLDIQKRSLRLQAAAASASRNPGGRGSVNPYLRFPSNSSSSSSSLRRSIRRSQPPVSASSADGDEEDAEGHGSGRRGRREKELNLVLKAEEGEGSHRKRGAAADADRDKVGSSGSNKSAKATDSKQEEVFNSGPTTPLPDQKQLVLILDRLQKKDTYMVFSEPVDPEELPDYHDIIDHPMDFGTVREKLSSGKYSSLEQFEKDVFLISSNAMSYNASDTVYFRQARAIHELAKKNFENLRQECDGNEAQPKPVVRRGRPPNKFKKALDNVTEQNQLYRSDKSGNAEDSTCSPNTETFSWLSKQKLDMNDDYSGLSSLKGFTKYGKNPPVIDESRRNTYKQPEWSTSAYEHPVHAIFARPRKFIVPVGINMEHACARSIARFAANFGPIGWAVAARRLERLLPLGTKFGPGWVGEGESLAKAPQFSASLVKCTGKISLLPVLNSLPSTMTKSGNDKLVQIEEASSNKTEVQGGFSRTPQSVLSPAAELIRSKEFFQLLSEAQMGRAQALGSYVLTHQGKKRVQQAGKTSRLVENSASSTMKIKDL